jgi:hypothetical protein
MGTRNAPRELIEALGLVGSPSRRVREALDMPPGPLLAGLVAELNLHRVRAVARANVELAGGAGSPLHTALCASATADPRDGLRIGALDDLFEGIPFLYIKGSVVSTLYPPTHAREHEDVDIYLPLFDDLWRVLRVSGTNYAFDRLKVHLYARDRIAGSVALEPKAEGAGLPSIDVHAESFPIWGPAHFELDFERRVGIARSLAPAWEESLLLIAAHATKQWFFRQRDVNDTFFLLRHRGESLDWEYVREKARALNIAPMLEILLNHTQRLYPDVRMPPGASRSGRAGPVERAFARRCWGRVDYPAALAMHGKMLWPRYRDDFGRLRGSKECAWSMKNLVRYDNRAYIADDRRRLGPLVPNRLLVLVPLEAPVPANASGRRVGDSELRIVSAGAPEEYFLTPNGPFVRTSYRGSITPDEARLVTAHVVSGQGARAGR